MTIILFIAVLFFLILVHELGHFLTAKWAKMRVDEFAIGFPPRLFSIRKGETEYSINLLPIGGYVKIFGENGEDVAAVQKTTTSVQNSRYSFASRPRLLQAIVLLAGVTMNILAALLIFIVVAMVGTPTAISEEEWHETGQGDLTVTMVVPESPAAAAGIPVGAKISQVQTNTGNLQEATPSAFMEFINKHQDETINVTYLHKKEIKTATLAADVAVLENNPKQKAVGLATAIVDIKNEDPLTAVVTGATRTYESLVAISVGLVSFFASAFTLSANMAEVTGPIGIAGMVGDAAEFGFTSLLIFTAFISLNLAVINLLPIPALDGGRLMFVIAEAIIRRPINPEWMARVNFIGFAFLILLMIAVTYNDLLRLF